MSDVRLIDANALLVEVAHRNALDVIPGSDFEKIWLYSTVQRDMFNIVKEAPTIDAVEVVHGRVVWKNRFMGGFVPDVTITDKAGEKHTGTLDTTHYEPVPYCSVCGKELGVSSLAYCPNCGAKMDAKDMDVPTKGDEEE